MIHTSNYANIKNLNIDDCLSISVGTPPWYSGKKFKELQPTWNMVTGHKDGTISDKEYTKMYYELVLNKLNKDELIEKLDNKILLCWCGKSKFCHRHILREWLNDYKPGICSEI